jgi:hypothetical protein
MMTPRDDDDYESKQRTTINAFALNFRMADNFDLEVASVNIFTGIEAIDMMRAIPNRLEGVINQFQ